MLINTCIQRNITKGTYIIITKASRQGSPSPFCKYKVSTGLQALKARPYHIMSFIIAKSLRVTTRNSTRREEMQTTLTSHE